MTADAGGGLPAWNPAAEHLFARLGLLLTTEPDLESRLGELAGTLVPALADCCILHKMDADGGVETMEAAAADPDQEALLRGLVVASPDPRSRERSLVARVLRTSAPLFLPEDELYAPASSRLDEQDLALLGHLGARSVIAVPLVARGTVIGTLTLVVCSPHASYQPADVALALGVAGRVAFALDQARRYRAALRAVAQRDEVLSIVAHDVGNALSAVTLTATLLLGRAPDGPDGQKTRDLLALIQNRVTVMAHLLKDLLEASRIESGHVHLEREPRPADEEVVRAVEALKPLADARSIQLHVLPAGPLPPVYVDGRRLLQVLENIIGNAVRFTPPNGQITIRMAQAGDSIQYSIADTGPGIAADHLPHVFDWFWQAPHEHEAGCGLGLAIAQRIVQLHGGRLSVESREGEGATFSFTVPAAEDGG